MLPAIGTTGGITRPQEKPIPPWIGRRVYPAEANDCSPRFPFTYLLLGDNWARVTSEFSHVLADMIHILQLRAGSIQKKSDRQIVHIGECLCVLNPHWKLLDRVILASALSCATGYLGQCRPHKPRALSSRNTCTIRALKTKSDIVLTKSPLMYLKMHLH